MPAPSDRHAAQGFALTYRPDIDGLRAIAVAAVVLFHAEIPGFSGGYVGVDVFFVISGYLITRLLAGTSLSPPRLGLRDFYLRRARRILPALFAMALAATVASIVILLPWDLARFGNYLAATSVLGTNIAAWMDGIGYFQSKSAQLPLTHLWSIAIEEQFYLTYPIALMLICRHLPRYRTACLLALAAASFILCVWGSFRAPAANFFLAPSRGWELLLGGALATSRDRAMGSRLANELLSLFGLAILAFAVGKYGPATPYPGLYALAPCGATAMLIASGRHRSTVTGTVLSLRPLVFTGLISYSIYLWHFPVLVLAGYYSIVKIDALHRSMLIACIFILAVSSWKWIEMPIRTRALLTTNRSFLLAAVVVNIAILGTGMALWKSNGLPRRFEPEIQARGGPWRFDDERISACVSLPLDRIAAGDLCSLGPQDNSSTRGLVWGDSHALALLPAYEKLATGHHLRLFFAIRSSCRPLVGFTNRTQSEATRMGCETFNAAVAHAVRQLDPQLLILNAHWNDVDADLIPQSTADIVPGQSNFARGLRETITQVGSAHRIICVVMDVPELNYNLPDALGVARKRGMAEDFLKLSRTEAMAQYQAGERDIRALEQRGFLRSVDPKEVLCRTGSCTFESDGNLLYWDADHLSPAGAEFVSSAIDGCFRNIGPAESR